MKSPVQLYLRVRLPDGTYPYLTAAYTANGRLRPRHAIRNGRAEEFPAATYYLRYWRDGKRVWEQVGDDASLAQIALQRKVLSLQIDEPSTPPTPISITPATAAPTKRLLADCVTTYLDETKAHKSEKTLAAYCLAVTEFVALMHEKLHIEDLRREDLLAYAASLRTRGCANRTVRNRVNNIQTFIHRFKIESLLKKNDLPTYTKKKVRAYLPGDLTKMFDCATQDEADLLHFFLCTGAREQEAEFVCWTDVDQENKTYTVTEHADLGFTPKDKEEGTVPIPDLLVNALKARRVRYPKTRLIFPRADGKPNGHLLRIVKRLALRAGANCGDCVNKKGLSCIAHPVCKHILLHKLRKTFASTLHHNGLPAQTIQRYLKHSELATTVAYIADQPDEQVRETINATFTGFSGRAA